MTYQKVKKAILPTLKREGVRKAALFGSVARNEAKNTSDVDLLVQLKKGATLLDLSGLKIELEKKLGRRVDVITYHSLHPLLKDEILEDQRIIYEKKS